MCPENTFWDMYCRGICWWVSYSLRFDGLLGHTPDQDVHTMGIFILHACTIRLTDFNTKEVRACSPCREYMYGRENTCI
jgi:hypothetical protein